jgi:hypothetical protein
VCVQVTHSVTRWRSSGFDCNIWHTLTYQRVHIHVQRPLNHMDNKFLVTKLCSSVQSLDLRWPRLAINCIPSTGRFLHDWFGQQTARYAFCASVAPASRAQVGPNIGPARSKPPHGRPDTPAQNEKHASICSLSREKAREGVRWTVTALSFGRPNDELAHVSPRRASSEGPALA